MSMMAISSTAMRMQKQAVCPHSYTVKVVKVTYLNNCQTAEWHIHITVSTFVQEHSSAFAVPCS
jgi:hypothetical protein